MPISAQKISNSLVAPYAGAWIEMVRPQLTWLPILVAPYAGAWIEIVIPHCRNTVHGRRTLRRCVD